MTDDNTQLVQRTGGDLAPANHSAGPLGSILSNPEALKEIPIETVERLFELHRQEVAGEARMAFFAAMNRVRSRMVPVFKAANNTQTGSTFAQLESIQRMLDPLLNEEGFSYSSSTVAPVIENTMRVQLQLRHKGGHEEHHFLDGEVDSLGPKGAPTKTRLHGMGSTLTYCERQLLTKVFGVTLTNNRDDDDGNRGGVRDKPITADQAATLQSLAEEVGADVARFCVYMKAATLGDIPAREYRRAVAALEAKR